MEMIQDELSDRIIASARKCMTEKGVKAATVRDVLKDLGITNRVFYNRFHSMDEIRQILYTETVNRIRESILTPWDENTDFFEYVAKVAARTLEFSYETRKDLRYFALETDTSSNVNFDWWNREIRKLLHIGKAQHLIREDLEENTVAYGIWCFIRGFNADAIARNLPQEDALRRFYYGFGLFLDGIKA